MKKIISMILAAAMILTVSMASARVLEPDDTEVERLAGRTVHATVGPYDPETKTFTLTVYDYDRYDDDDVPGLAAGDTVLAGGFLYKITGQTQADGDTIYTTDSGEEIYFGRSFDDHDDMIARSTLDDRIFMHAVNEVHLPAAEGIVYEDDSDPDAAAPAVVTGLEAVLAAQAEKTATSIGFHFYSTLVTLNGNLEIVKIHQDYDVMQ